MQGVSSKYLKCYVYHYYYSMSFSDEHFVSPFWWNEFELKFFVSSKAYSEPCQISKMEFSAKIVNGFQLLTIFAKNSMLDVWHDSEYSAHHKASINFWI